MMCVSSCTSLVGSSNPVSYDRGNSNISEENRISTFVPSFLKTSAVTAGISTAIASIGGCAFYSALFLFLFRSVKPIETVLFQANVLGAILTGAVFAKNKKVLGLTLGTIVTIGSFLTNHLADHYSVLTQIALTAISLISYVTISVSGNKEMPRKILIGHLLGMGGLIVSFWIVLQVNFGALAYCTIPVTTSIIANMVAMYARKNNPDSTVAKVASSIAFMSAIVTLLGIVVGVSERASSIAFWGGKLPEIDAVSFSQGYNYEMLVNAFQAGSHIQAKELALAGAATISAACVLKREGKITNIAKDFFASFVGNAVFSSAMCMIFQGSMFPILPMISLLVATGVVAARILKI
ncbi:MAG: hypothetical protein K1000chlam3_01312 [Chlamydiae bacterium]|nr:hypothetical protein [Chlamydiota bacterium]